MRLRQTFPLALVALLRNKARSLLTSLGVVIGVASVISMVSVGEGAKSRVESIFASMGTNMLVVLSGSTSGNGSGRHSHWSAIKSRIANIARRLMMFDHP